MAKKNTGPKIIRHGDIIFRRIDEVPADMKSHKINHKGAFVVAEGETTGHNHTLFAQDMELYKKNPADPNSRLVMNFPTGAKVTHPEHNQLQIPEGVYMEDREQEFDWFSKATVQVVD